MDPFSGVRSRATARFLRVCVVLCCVASLTSFIATLKGLGAIQAVTGVTRGWFAHLWRWVKNWKVRVGVLLENCASESALVTSFFRDPSAFLNS